MTSKYCAILYKGVGLLEFTGGEGGWANCPRYRVMTVHPRYQKESSLFRNQKFLVNTHISSTFSKSCNEKKTMLIMSSVFLHL